MGALCSGRPDSRQQEKCNQHELPVNIGSSSIANHGRTKVQVMKRDDASGSPRANATRRVYLYQPPQSPTSHFSFELTGCDSLTGFGLLVQVAAAVISTFFLFLTAAGSLAQVHRSFCPVHSPTPKQNGYFDTTIATATSQ